MTKKIKIVVVGIGGVGGYFGGLLAKKYHDSKEVEIIFVARGEHLKQIQTAGLKIIKAKDEFIVNPALATDHVNEIGIADYIIVCTKGYDLEKTIQQLKPCIDKNSIVLPLLNGVDAAERIKSILPGTTVLNGCVYIGSRLKAAGIVENIGNIQALYFGLDNITDERSLLLEKLLKEAAIDATLSSDISTLVWGKFIFIAPMATATSYFNSTIGEVMLKEEETIVQLIEEVKKIALAKGIGVDKDISAITLTRIKGLPYEHTTSMHIDYRNLKQHTEVESLTGYVVRAGRELNIATPVFNKMYDQLTGKNIK